MKKFLLMSLILIGSVAGARDLEPSPEVVFADNLKLENVWLVKVEDCGSICSNGKQLFKVKMSVIYSNSCRAAKNIIVLENKMSENSSSYTVVGGYRKSICPAVYAPVTKNYDLGYVILQDENGSVTVNGVAAKK